MKIKMKLFIIFILVLNFSINGQNVDLDLLETIRKNDHKKTMELLTKGANVNATDIFGWSSLMIAAQNGNISIAQTLIKSGANVNKIDGDGWNALMYSSNLGHLGIVKKLIKAKADVNIKDKNGFSALKSASDNGFKEIEKILLLAGARD